MKFSEFSPEIQEKLKSVGLTEKELNPSKKTEGVKKLIEGCQWCSQENYPLDGECEWCGKHFHLLEPVGFHPNYKGKPISWHRSDIYGNSECYEKMNKILLEREAKEK